MTQPETMHQVRFYPLIFPVIHSSRGRPCTPGLCGTMEEEDWERTQKMQSPEPESEGDSQPPCSSSTPEKQHKQCLLERNLSFEYRVETVYKFLIPWHWKYGDRLFWIFGDKCIHYTTCPQFSCGEKKNMASRITRSSSIGQKASLHKQHILKPWDQWKLHQKCCGEGDWESASTFHFFLLGF